MERPNTHTEFKFISNVMHNFQNQKFVRNTEFYLFLHKFSKKFSTAFSLTQRMMFYIMNSITSGGNTNRSNISESVIVCCKTICKT